MKSISAYIFALSLVSASCSNAELENELAETKEELSQTKVELLKRDSILDDISSSFSMIDSNLLRMQETENLVMVELNKGREKDKEALLTHVELLQNLMQQNKERIEKMREDYGNEKSTMSEMMTSALDGMNEKVLINNLRLSNLNSHLNSLGDDYRLLIDENLQAEAEQRKLKERLARKEKLSGQMETRMKEMDNYLNTVYVCIGTKRELTKQGVLESGGIIKSKDFNEDVDRMAFQPKDLREYTEVVIQSSKVKVITEHPSDSYSIKTVGDETTLSIEIPTEFWSISKYLVVVKN